MRAINKPTGQEIDISTVIELCISGVNDRVHQAKLRKIIPNIIAMQEEYDLKALNSTLFELVMNNDHKDSEFLDGITKKQFSALYSQYMVGEKKPARKIYSFLKGLAPNGKCPFCGYCDATTLDHFLPKSKYPLLTVLPLNLVPSCPYCNTGKSTDVALKAEDQILHPYYDHSALMDEQWVFADVIPTIPATIKFYVKAPDKWDKQLEGRVLSHFVDNKLASRFSLQAADELSALRQTLEIYHEAQGIIGVKFNLKAQAISEFKKYKNSWKTAMYQALEKSDWFCREGFFAVDDTVD
jgi:hypothetical protein